MLDFGKVWGVAMAEARLTRRLARFWLFQVIAFILGLGAYGYYAAIHYFVSYQSATVSLITPRFLLAFLGTYYVLVLCIGILFLAFDIRARDERERMVEVLDARPMSNVELLLGKFLGILIPSWIPAVITSIVIVSIGFIIGETVQPLSVVTFGLWMAIPAYAFAIGLTFLVQLLVRHRMITFVVVIVILGGMMFISIMYLPIYAAPALDLAGNLSIPFASDLTPRMIDMAGALQRLAYLLMGLGFLGPAAAFHPRQDDGSKAKRLMIGFGMIAVGIALVLYIVGSNRAIVTDRAHWKEVHAALAEEPEPDIQSIRGDIDLRPGKGMSFDLAMTIAAPQDGSLQTARFTLNPGLKVESIESGGTALQWTQKDGLVEVALGRTLSAGSTLDLQWKAKGKLQPRFSYLDAAFDPLERGLLEANVILMGYDPSVDDRRFAALMPGVYWLPTSGAVPIGDDGLTPESDFYNLDISVRVPDGFKVAGPGRGTVQGNEISFSPGAPVADIALIAGKFVSRSTEIGGVQLEILVAPSHAGNLEVFSEAWGEIEGWIQERLDQAEAVGFGYPYDGLTMVETPGYLRGYGGGWRMDSTLYQPGMILMRESGFPTANFHRPFSDPESLEDRDGGVALAKWEQLIRFFENDFTGGNPFLGASKNFFGYQTAAKGADGVPLEFVSQDLSNRLVTEKEGYFSVHHFDKDMNQTINRSITAIFTTEGRGLAETIIRSITARAEVWDRVLGVGLTKLEPREDPKRAVDVLTLKGGAMSRSLFDAFGAEQAGQLMSALRTRTSGRTFVRSDVIAAGQEVGIDLEPWLDVWIDQTELPGFSVRDAVVVRIADSAEGGRRYQTRLVLQNDESVPGMLRVRYEAGEDDDETNSGETDPIRIEPRAAVEIGIVTGEVPESIVVEPYLSLNRGDFTVNVTPPDEDRIEEIEPLIGAQPVEWQERIVEGIVVDDLDPGFSIIDEAPKPWWQFGDGEDDDEPTDGGLPIRQFNRGVSAEWSRGENTVAFGVYRHTMAIAKKGNGDRRAVFAAEIPRAGSWELEYYLQTTDDRNRSARGTINLKIEDSSGENAASLDSSNAEGGWNSLGTFEIAEGEVRVIVSNETDGRYVIADAIRWIPAR